jgi:uncharacterized protein (TIGR02246 family)
MAVGKALETIPHVNQAFVTAFGKGDAQAVAALYARGAQVFPPHSDVLQSPDTIRGFWQSVMDMGIRQAALETVGIESISDTMAIEQGRYTLSLESGAVADTGKYLVVWTQEDGAWKIYRDIWNTNQPRQ